MNIRKSWNLVAQRKMSPCSGSVSQRQLNHGFGATPIIMGDLIWKFAKILWGQHTQNWSVSIRISSGNVNASVVVTSQYPQIYEKISLEKLHFLCFLGIYWQVCLSMYHLLLPHSMNGLITFCVLFGTTLMKK